MREFIPDDRGIDGEFRLVRTASKIRELFLTDGKPGISCGTAFPQTLGEQPPGSSLGMSDLIAIRATVPSIERSSWVRLRVPRSGKDGISLSCEFY
jgi:hypothetical protein